MLKYLLAIFLLCCFCTTGMTLESRNDLVVMEETYSELAFELDEFYLTPDQKFVFEDSQNFKVKEFKDKALNENSGIQNSDNIAEIIRKLQWIFPFYLLGSF